MPDAPNTVHSSATNCKRDWNCSFLMNIAKRSQQQQQTYKFVIGISQASTADLTQEQTKCITQKPPPPSAGSSGLEDKANACSSIKPSS